MSHVKQILTASLREVYFLLFDIRQISLILQAFIAFLDTSLQLTGIAISAFFFGIASPISPIWQSNQREKDYGDSWVCEEQRALMRFLKAVLHKKRYIVCPIPEYQCREECSCPSPEIKKIIKNALRWLLLFAEAHGSGYVAISRVTRYSYRGVAMVMVVVGFRLRMRVQLTRAIHTWASGNCDSILWLKVPIFSYSWPR